MIRFLCLTVGLGSNPSIVTSFIPISIPSIFSTIFTQISGYIFGDFYKNSKFAQNNTTGGKTMKGITYFISLLAIGVTMWCNGSM